METTMMMTTPTDLVWNAGSGSGTCLQGWLDLPTRYDVNAAIATLEAAAGTKGDWELNDYGAHDWWGLTGTFKGNLFTVYTYKSGTLKIGGLGASFVGGGESLDLPGLKAALLALIQPAPVPHDSTSLAALASAKTWDTDDAEADADGANR